MCPGQCPFLNYILNGEWLIPRWFSHKKEPLSGLYLLSFTYRDSCNSVYIYTMPSAVYAWECTHLSHICHETAVILILGMLDNLVTRMCQGPQAKLCEREQAKVCSWWNEVALALLYRYQNWGVKRISTAFPSGLKNMNAVIEEALFEVSQVELSAEYSHCPTTKTRNQVQKIPG